MASFDPSKANCEVPEGDQYVPDDRISHTHFSPNYNEDSLAAFLNPVVDYSIGFGARVWWLPTQEGAKGKVKRVYLCPGAKITFAKPKELGHTRVQLDLEGVRLRDLVNNPELNWNE